jgi:hypothetical protein
MTDNIAVLRGFTKDIIIETPTECIIALVKPETNFTRLYLAWDTDAQEFVKIDGIRARWNMAYGTRYS